jgi:DNA uptake protein ComE-like DNA-binding protein
MRYRITLLVTLLGLVFTSPCYAQKRKATPNPELKVQKDVKIQKEAQEPCLDVEEASAKDLTSLKGVGDVLAKRIIDYRQLQRTAATKGGKPKWMFRNWATLMKVQGIGPKICEDNRERVCFSGKVQKTCPK